MISAPIRKPKTRLGPHWTWPSLALLVLLFVACLVQGQSLLKRVTHGATDFTVFYNTGQQLRDGKGAEIYREKDADTEWLRTIPPFGQFIVHPFTALDIPGAAIAWAAFNLLLLLAAGLCLHQLGPRLGNRTRLFSAITPGLVLILFALAPGSIQVGQFSVLFAACWIFYLRLRRSRYAHFAEAALAIPAAVKLYPALLLAVPALQREWRRVAAFCAALAIAVVLPVLAYGGRTQELTASFWDNAIASPDGRVQESQRARSVSNQGLDSIALRFLCTDQPIHRRFPQLPHAALPPKLVIRGVTILRILILGAALVAGLLYSRRPGPRGEWDTLLLCALLSATLYLILPGAKSRYAIYEVLAFAPLLAQAYVCRRLGRTAQYWCWNALSLVCLLGVMQMMPAAVRVWGVSLWTVLALWIANMALMLRWSQARNASPKLLNSAALPHTN